MVAAWGLLLVACSPEVYESHPGNNDLTSLPHTASATATTKQDTGWEKVDAALEFRRLPVTVEEHTSEFIMLRLDPAAYHIRVAYDADHPGRVSQWATAIKPIAIINGGYFDESKRATALVVFDGIVRGSSYEGFGGMVVVNESGGFELRSLRQHPYDANEALQQAMQSAPMLIQPGGVLSDLEADDDRSRRTVIGRDTHGRILLIACDWPVFTLKELASALKTSDLELDAALNLDGGRSTGLFLQTPTLQLTVDSFDSVPLVLVVDRKE
jgi:exopolysaccharide biosynthesis protein